MTVYRNQKQSYCSYSYYIKRNCFYHFLNMEDFYNRYSDIMVGFYKTISFKIVENILRPNHFTSGYLFKINERIRSDQIRSVTQSCPTLCDPMNHSTPGLPVHHQLPEFTQTHVHRVRDAIQPSHPLSSPSPPAPNPSQHESFPVSQLLA